MEGEVLIVDEHTAASWPGAATTTACTRHRGEGGRDVREEYQTCHDHLQNYFRLYDKLSGMTGTAMTRLGVRQDLRPRRGADPDEPPMQRVDNVDLVYRTEEAKYEAVADDIRERHEKGQPILIGTVSVEKSEYLSNLLRKRGIAHTASTPSSTPTRPRSSRWPAQGRGHRRHQHGRSRHRHHARRSVDFLADQELRKQGSTGRGARGLRRRWPAMVERIKAQVAASTTRSRLGGSTCRHERTSRAASTTSCAASGARATGESGSTCAAGRDDAAVQVGVGRPDPHVSRCRRRADRRQAVSSASRARQHRVQNFECARTSQYDDVMSRSARIYASASRLEGPTSVSRSRLHRRRDHRLRRGATEG